MTGKGRVMADVKVRNVKAVRFSEDEHAVIAKKALAKGLYLRQYIMGLVNKDI